MTKKLTKALSRAAKNNDISLERKNLLGFFKVLIEMDQDRRLIRRGEYEHEAKTD